ncbi:MAG TPA: T9SS type A sorting domain-containing protein [Ignavibacteria bacterium]|nr:T9SS type A sorting domain-containing protein [Ignavibacteria bacterium]
MSLTFITDESIAQWTPMSNGLGNDKFISAISKSGNNIYVSVFNGIYKSTNNGKEWIRTPMGNLSTIYVTAKENNVYTSVYNACNNSSGIYHSTDYGETWKQTSIYERLIPTIAVTGKNVFAGSWLCLHPGGVYKSSDNGINWENTLTNLDIESLFLSDTILYAGAVNNPFSSGGLYKSTNMGVNWLFLGLNNRSILSCAVSEDKIYAGTFAGIFVSTNNGDNWTQTSLNNQWIRSIVVSGDNVIVGTERGGVFLSRNKGINWVERNEGLDTLDVRCLLISEDFVLAGTRGKGIYKRSLSEIVNVNQSIELFPSDYLLSQNFPNPFNPVTKINFSIPKQGMTTLKVYDVTGRLVASLINEIKAPGFYSVNFEGTGFASGAYFYKLESLDFSDVKRMILVK